MSRDYTISLKNSDSNIYTMGSTYNNKDSQSPSSRLIISSRIQRNLNNWSQSINKSEPKYNSGTFNIRLITYK